MTPADHLVTHILPGFVVTKVCADHPTLTITAHPARDGARCPTCGVASDHIHSYYTRSPRDVPISGMTVHLRLHLRRFRCRNSNCARATFAERLSLVRPWAQQTARRQALLPPLATAVSGEAGARLSHALGLASSPDTLLNVVRDQPVPASPPPHQIGLDDWALRKGHIYGTIIVDLAQHRPIDLLPDRSAETVAAWLRAHPSVAVVARDRRTEYIRGITAGAPHAVQVADRWHLLANMRDVVEQLLRRQYQRLHALPSLTTMRVPRRRPQQRTATELAARQAVQEERVAQYHTIRRLAATGMRYRTIARQLHISWRTVERYAATDTVPAFAPRHPVPSLLDPYLRYLHHQWAHGRTNASQLWQAIAAQGYPGGYRQVARWAQQQHQSGTSMPTPARTASPTAPTDSAALPTAAPLATLPSVRQLVWILVQDPDKLHAEQHAVREQLQHDATMDAAYGFVQRFQSMVRTHDGTKLTAWLEDVGASGIPELHTFAKGLQQDLPAVRAALEYAASNGQTEGQVNRLKLIKRQGYGRASFDLLRKRVLATP